MQQQQHSKHSKHRPLPPARLRGLDGGDSAAAQCNQPRRNHAWLTPQWSRGRLRRPCGLACANMDRIDPTATVLQLHTSLRPHYLRMALWWHLRSHKLEVRGDDSAPLLLQPRAQCSRLVHLTLSMLGLTAVPSSLASSGVIPALQKLDLSLNSLTTLAASGRGGSCDWLHGIPGLTELNVSNNCLAALPPELGELAALKKLRAGANMLRALPLELSELAELRELYLHSNALTAPVLEPILYDLSQLEVLDVNHNLLSSLPMALAVCIRPDRCRRCLES